MCCKIQLFAFLATLGFIESKDISLELLQVKNYDCVYCSPLEQNLLPSFASSISFIRNISSCLESIGHKKMYNTLVHIDVRSLEEIKVIFEKTRESSPISLFENLKVLISSSNPNLSPHNISTIFQLSNFDNNFPTLTSLIFFLFPTNSFIFPYQIWELYAIEPRKFVFSKIPISRNSYFDYTRTLQLQELVRIIPRRQNLLGTKLKILGKTTPGNQAETTIEESGDGKANLVNGLTVSILHDLKDALNFTVEGVKGEEFMRENLDGSLTGIGRQIIEGNANLSIALSNILPYRLKWLTFLQPIMADRLRTFYISPSSGSLHNIVISPFRRDLWLVIGFTWTLIVLSTHFVQKFTYGNGKQFEKGEIVMCAIGIVCGQGWYKGPKSITLRMIFLISLLTSVITIAAYSASIVSILSHRVDPITKYTDLFDFKYEFIGNVSTKYMNIFIPDDKQAEYLQNLAEKRFISSNDTILQLFNPKRRIAFTETLNQFYYGARNLGFNDQDLCTVKSFIAASKFTKVAMFIKKNSPLKEYLNVKLILIMERGLIYLYVKNYLAKVGLNCIQHKFEHEQLSLEDSITIHIIFFAGLVLSLIFLVIEIIFHRVEFNRLYMFIQIVLVVLQ